MNIDTDIGSYQFIKDGPCGGTVSIIRYLNATLLAIFISLLSKNASADFFQLY